MRERGWTYWHHLFTPRQLLIHGVIADARECLSLDFFGRVDVLLGVGRAADWDSKLCRWGTGAARESISQSFYNQALNTLFNYPSKGLQLLWGNCGIEHESMLLAGGSEVSVDGPGLFRRGDPREPRSRAAEPSAVALRPAREPQDPGPVSEPGDHRGRRPLLARQLQEFSHQAVSQGGPGAADRDHHQPHARLRDRQATQEPAGLAADRL